MKLEELPKTIPIFPLSNFIMFPGTTVPLNIFEPRYLQMVNDSMKKHRMIGMIQPKKTGSLKKPDLYEIGCIGKITSFNETEDGRMLVACPDRNLQTLCHETTPLGHSWTHLSYFLAVQ